MKAFFTNIFKAPGFPKLSPEQIIHGEQIVEIFEPIAPGATVKCIAVIEDVADKVKGMLLTIRTDILDPENSDFLYSRCYMKFFVIGCGGFGDKGILDLQIPIPPTRVPDHSVEVSTDERLAFFYRLWGDDNPLHIIPSAAKSVGFDKPILHGLWTYGILARAVYEAYWEGDTSRIKAVSARFVSHIFPGETIKIDLFKEDTSVFFSAATLERSNVIWIGVVDLKPQAKL